MVLPLPEDAPGLDAGVLEHLEGGEGVVGVHVPVLKAPHQVDRALVVVQDILKVVALVPVAVPLVSRVLGRPVGGPGGQGPQHRITAKPQLLGRVSLVHRRTLVQHVVDEGAALGRAVAIEHLPHADGAGDGDDGLEMGTAIGLGRLPGGGAGVGLADDPHVAVGPLLLPKPVDDGLDAQLLGAALDVLAVGRFAGAEGGGLGQGVAVLDELIVDPLSHATIGLGDAR